MVNPLYYALSADLVRSRRVSNRGVFSQHLERSLSDVSAEYESEFLAPIMSVKGVDELSAVLLRPDLAFSIIADLNERTWPQSFRWGIGLGGIDVARNSGNASAMDGGAFHAASTALRRALSDKLPLAIEAKPWNPLTITAMEQSARLHVAIVQDWSKAAASAAAQYRKYGTQQQVADSLGISVQAVSKSLHRARYHELREFERMMQDWLTAAGARKI